MHAQFLSSKKRCGKGGAISQHRPGMTSSNVGCHPINQSPRFQTRTDVAWGRIDEIASDYADQEWRKRIKNGASASRMAPAHQEWRQYFWIDVVSIPICCCLGAETCWMDDVSFCMKIHIVTLSRATDPIFEFRLRSWDTGYPYGYPQGAKMAKKFFPRLQFFVVDLGPKWSNLFE